MIKLRAGHIPYYVLLLALLGCQQAVQHKKIDWDHMGYSNSICGNWKTHDPNCTDHDEDVYSIGKGRGKR